ncbi:FKBP-type peptidyl-prolyl cis-trans isomerase [Deinococcus sp.]|uniref:FKBP-type peptidyl-prolyl cis-trans isomerase n=1 Tax=Deinococcus sp. TaxID=47478 RepID=UPI003CC59C83
MNISQDKVVEIDYVLKVDGEVVDRSEENDPLTYLHGHNNIIPGLEKALEGHAAGDHLNVTVSPEEGYGERDDENVQMLPKADFDDDVEIGASYFAQSDDGSVNPFTVMSVEGDDVKVDFNPPLAGKTLNFDVTVKTVRDATEEELAHGHAHGEDMHDDDEDFDDE